MSHAYYEVVIHTGIPLGYVVDASSEIDAIERVMHDQKVRRKLPTAERIWTNDALEDFASAHAPGDSLDPVEIKVTSRRENAPRSDAMKVTMKITPPEPPCITADGRRHAKHLWRQAAADFAGVQCQRCGMKAAFNYERYWF
jgi:hypothetical protein